MYKIDTNIPNHIFRGYDIRGVVDKDLSEDRYYTLGRAYGTYLYQRRIKECPVGHDNRLTSKAYAKAFIQGLNDSGINTYYLGYSLTQIIYFSNYFFRTRASAMITASHNPKEYNGLKLSTGYSETMVSDEIQNLKSIAQSGKFYTPKQKGKNKDIDIFEEYKKDILKHFKLNKKWKIVIDANTATPGLFYPKILRDAGVEVIEQNCELDGNFPLGTPDPTEVEVLERLSKAVKKHKADLGFSYDSDGDRLAVVDENGTPLWMDTIVALFAIDVLDFIKGAPIVFNTLCSMQVKETIKKHKGKPIMWLTGHSFIKAKIKELKAPFGGELSGHIFFMDNFYGHDDGAYASLRLLSLLERKNKTLSQLVNELPFYVSSPEIKFGLADDIKFKFIKTKMRKEFEKYFKNANFIDIEGVRVEGDDFMAIIRASQNGPYATIKFEAKTKQKYEEIKKILKKIITSYKEIDINKGVNIHALD